MTSWSSSTIVAIALLGCIACTRGDDKDSAEPDQTVATPEQPAADEPAAGPAEMPAPSPQAFRWPEGDPGDGREAFMELKCYTCHLVSSDSEFAALHEKHGPGAHPAPPLSHTTAQKPRDVLLQQIALPGTDPAVRDTHMASYGDTMTLQQLTDLVAYLQSL